MRGRTEAIRKVGMGEMGATCLTLTLRAEHELREASTKFPEGFLAPRKGRQGSWLDSGQAPHPLGFTDFLLVTFRPHFLAPNRSCPTGAGSRVGISSLSC